MSESPPLPPVPPLLPLLPGIPDWVPPSDTGIPPAGILDDLSLLRKQTFAARNTIIPISYGRDRIFGQPCVVHVDEELGFLYVAYSFGQGEITGYEQIIIDGEDKLALGTAYVGLKNRSFENGDNLGWSLGGGTDGTVNATIARTGVWGINVPSGAGGNSHYSDRIPAPLAETQLRINGYAQRNATPTSLPNTNTSIGVRYATTIGGALGSRIDVTTEADEAVAGWQLMTGLWEIPADAVEYIIDLSDSGSIFGSWDFDDISTEVLKADDGAIELQTDAIEIIVYRGEPAQPIDSLLGGVLTGYVDSLPDTAYVVLRVPVGSTRGFPRLEAILHGRRVYDPRLDDTQTTLVPAGAGQQRVNLPNTWVYSTNPAICFRDLIENFTGWDILDQGVVDLANYNDELLNDVKRREIGLTLNKPSKVEDWVKGFRTYMGAFIAWEGGAIRVIPNRADVELSRAVGLKGTPLSAVTIGNVSELDFAETQDFSVELAFKPAVGGGVTQMLFGKKIIPTGLFAGWAIYMDASDQIAVSVSDGTNGFIDTDVTTNVMDGEWHTIAFTVNQTANDLIVTVDGVARTPVDISAMTLTLASGSTSRIGANSGNGDLYSGLIDEVRVWDDVRTPAELTANRLAEIADPTSEANLVGYWKMNEATSETVAVDSSSSGNDGTLAGDAVFGDGNFQIIPDGVAMHITADDIQKDSLKLVRRSLRSVPNSVAIDYEDGSGSKWHTERVQADSPRVTSGDEARRLSRISLPGIHNASQAQREAIERLNWYLTDLEASLTLFDEGWQLQHGSIVAVTHPIGLDAKLFRVRRTNANSGRWVVDLVEYDPAIYSNEVIADPTTPDTNLGDPLNPPTISNLSLAEELFTYKNGLTGSRVRATWTATNYPFLSQYLVEGYVNGTRVWQQFTQANDVVTPPVEELVAAIPVRYEVRVYIQSPFAQGAVVTDTVDILGKLAVPGDVPTITLTQITTDSVDLTWGEAIDIDIWRYEVRIGTTSDAWAAATQLDLVDGLQYSATSLAIGDHRFFVKARDSVGNESVNAKTADISLAVPSPVLAVSGFEVASEVRLNWPAVVGGFVERYRVSYDTYPTPTTETTLDIVDTLRFQTKDVPEGTFEFSIWARDRNGSEALTAATIVIEVTSDADAFLADTYNFGVSPSLTNVVSYTLRTDPRTFYVTNMADSFAVSPTDFVASDPLANYHSVGASEWLSESHDFGLLLTGSWNLTHDTTALQGNITVELELSAEDDASPSEGSFIVFTGAAKGTFRHARVRISTFNPPGTATTYVKTPLMSLKINVVPLEESGEDVSTTSEGIGKTIRLVNEYTALKEIVVQPKNTIATGTAVTAVVDNIVIGPNTGIQCDGTDYLQGGDFFELNFGIGDFTIEYWTKHNGSADANQTVLTKRNGSQAGYLVQHGYGSDEIHFSIEDVSTNTVTATTTGDALPDDGSYHHVAITVNRTANEVRIYVDSVLAGGSPHSIASVTGSLNAAVNFNVFATSAGTSIHGAGGIIDELRVWSDVRTPTEIADNMNAEVLSSAAGLVGYWKMDGPVGGVVVTADDSHANNNDLTDTGAGDLVYVDPGNVGNVIQKVNSFDVFIWDTFGQQLSEQFQWKWKAV